MAKNVERQCPACGLMKSFRSDQKTCGCNVKPEEVETDERTGNERFFKKVLTKPVKTLQELARVCEIDTSEWEIYKWKCGTWTTGMKNKKLNVPFYATQYVVMAWMRLKTNVVAAKNEIEALRKKAASYSPAPVALSSNYTSEKVMAEFSIFDHHFGSLIWGKETGYDDYDQQIAKSTYEAAITSLLERTRAYAPKDALLVLGNDQQNIDNRAGTTEAGTPQHSDSRYQKIFGISRDCAIWAIDALASTHQHVHVMMVPGNHDYLATWHLGDSLSSWYRRYTTITIDNSPLFRKYLQYGVNMLMFTHGNKGKLDDYGKVMAAERPDMWGKTLWREAHTGDKHQRRLLELKGATVRILPSLRPPDSWSSENHFVGSLRAAEAYIWDEREGLIGTSVYSILKRK